MTQIILGTDKLYSFRLKQKFFIDKLSASHLDKGAESLVQNKKASNTNRNKK